MHRARGSRACRVFAPGPCPAPAAAAPL